MSLSAGDPNDGRLAPIPVRPVSFGTDDSDGTDGAGTLGMLLLNPPTAEVTLLVADEMALPTFGTLGTLGTEIDGAFVNGTDEMFI